MDDGKPGPRQVPATSRPQHDTAHRCPPRAAGHVHHHHPLQTHKVGIELPTGPVYATPQPDPVRNRITIDAGNVIRWNGMAVDQAGLRVLLRRSVTLAVEPALDLLPAADARYDLVDSVLAEIRRAGVSKLGLPGNEAYGAF